jgi:hypothetical protein
MIGTPRAPIAPGSPELGHRSRGSTSGAAAGPGARSTESREVSSEFDLKRIEEALRSFQRNFRDINARLSLQREEITDEIIANICDAYGYLNGLMSKGVDLFSLAGLHSLIELNHRVLCGSDTRKRYEFHSHILETRKKFHKRIRPIRAWMIKNADRLDPYQISAGFYCRMLCQPQLFIEGNHRTGNLVLNYILLKDGEKLFVVTDETAFDYLEVSGTIKLSSRKRLSDNLLKLPLHCGTFEAFLRRSASPDYLRDS